MAEREMLEITINIESEDDPSLSTTIPLHCYLNEEGNVEVDCPQCHRVFSLNPVQIQENETILCPRCAHEDSSQVFLLEMHPEVIEEYEQFASEVLADKLGEMLEAAFRGNKYIKFRNK